MVSKRNDKKEDDAFNTSNTFDTLALKYNTIEKRNTYEIEFYTIEDFPG